LGAEKGITLKKLIPTICFFCVFLFTAPVNAEKWKKWDNFPDVPRITAKQVKDLMLAGKKMVFIYAGYETKEVICGSFYVPYTLVPPKADGSRVGIKIPKDYWIMCY